MFQRFQSVVVCALAGLTLLSNPVGAQAAQIDLLPGQTVGSVIDTISGTADFDPTVQSFGFNSDFLGPFAQVFGVTPDPFNPQSLAAADFFFAAADDDLLSPAYSIGSNAASQVFTGTDSNGKGVLELLFGVDAASFGSTDFVLATIVFSDLMANPLDESLTTDDPFFGPIPGYIGENATLTLNNINVIPLPAGVVFMLTALGGLVLICRRAAA